MQSKTITHLGNQGVVPFFAGTQLLPCPHVFVDFQLQVLFGILELFNFIFQLADKRLILYLEINPILYLQLSGND